MRQIKVIIVTTSVLLLSFMSWGQETDEIDSLKHLLDQVSNTRSKLDILNALFIKTKDSDINQALAYLKRQEILAKSLMDGSHEADVDYNYGLYHSLNGSRDSANTYFSNSREYWKESSDFPQLIKGNNSFARSEYYMGRSENALKLIDKNIALIDSIKGHLMNKGDAYLIRGNINQSFGDKEKALKDFIVAEDIFSKGKDKSKYAMVLDDLGYLESLMGNDIKGIEFMEKAVELYKSLDNKRLLARGYQSLGAAHQRLEHIDLAEDYYKQTQKIAEEEGLKSAQADIYGHLAGLEIEYKRFDRAIAWLNKSLELHKLSGHKYAIAHTYQNLGSAYKDKQDYAEAIRQYDKGLAVAKEIDNAAGGIIYKLHGHKSDVHEKTGSYKKALAEYKKYKISNDSLNTREKLKTIESLRSQFDTEKKEQQIALQEKEITVLKQEVKIDRQNKLILEGGLIFSLIVFGLGFYGFYQKIKRNRMEKDTLDAELAFKRKELTTHALHLAKKNEVLESIKSKAQKLKEEGTSLGYQELIKTINFDQQDDKNWESFTQYFEQVHKDFASNVKIKYPKVTKNELRFMALIKMNMSSKEISTILNISPAGVKKARYRLRKKLGIAPEESLETLIISI